MKKSQTGQSPIRDDLIHRSRLDGKTYCGLLVDGLLVDVPRMGNTTYGEPPVTCPQCKRAIKRSRIAERVDELNRKKTARARTFALIESEVYGHESFDPQKVMERVVIRAYFLRKYYGAKEFNFKDSKRSGAIPACVFSRNRGKCHRCELSRRFGLCLHRLGPRYRRRG